MTELRYVIGNSNPVVDFPADIDKLYQNKSQWNLSVVELWKRREKYERKYHVARAHDRDSGEGGGIDCRSNNSS